MSIVRYRPTSLLSEFQREMNNLMGGQWPESTEYSNVAANTFAPAVDIKEEQKRFLITADLPGVDPKAIKVEMHEGVLTLSGEKTAESKTEKDGYVRNERFSGSFYRRFSFPDNVDAENIAAKCHHGVLEISVPKLEKAQKRQITVEG